MNPIQDRTIALAGVLQACSQVQALARSGKADEDLRETCLQSILILDAVNTPAVYGGLHGIKHGLTLIRDGILASPKAKNIEVLRYAMSLLHLQRQLYQDSDRYKRFGAAVDGLSALSADELSNACSKIYQNYISDMRPQIIVQGEQHYLQQAAVPPQVRSMLLAGIRSSVLWQQKGGGRFKLVWERTRMQNAARSLLRK